MAIRPDYSAGTITLTSGSASFTTTGAALQSASVQQGDTIYLPAKGLVLTIDSITGQNAGTLTGNCPADAAGATQAYAIRFQPDGSRLSGKTQALIDLLSAGGFFQYDASGPLADRAQYNAKPQGFSFLDTSTNPMGLYIKGSDTSGDWDGPVAYAQGEQGVPGPSGNAATIAVGTVTTLDPGEDATVNNSGTSAAAVLEFGIPKGRGFANKGEYAGATAYVVDDVVTYNGSTYISIQDGTGNLPTDPAYWSLLAAKGQDGTGNGVVQTLVEGNSVTVDSTDPANPVIAVSIGTTAGTAAAGDDARITGAAQKDQNLGDLADAGAARDNLGLGTAAVGDKQSSATDTTAGRLLAVGAFGIGVQVVETETDLNNYVKGGGYITPSSGLTNLPSGWSQGQYIVTVDGGASYCHQTIIAPATNDRMFRTSSGATWTQWQSIGAGDVVGPAASVDGRIPLFDGATGKLLKDGGKLLSDLAQIETGAWTPGVGYSAGGTDPTYTSQNGTYVKMGKMVWASFAIVLATKGSGSLAVLTGLPFVASARYQYSSNLWYSAWNNVTGFPLMEVQGSGTTARIYLPGASVVSSASSNTFNDNSQFFGTCVYEAAS